MALGRPPTLALLVCAAALACGSEPTTSLDAGPEADAGADRTDGGPGAPDAGTLPSDAGPISQRRLVLQTVQSTDGRAKGVVSLYDRRLDAPCATAAAPGAEGDVLCRPTTFAFTTYLDERCTTPFVATQARPGAVVFGYGASGEGRVVRVGSAVTPAPGQRWMSQPRGGCAPIDPSTAEAQGSVHAIAESWPDEALPQGRLVTDDADPWVRVQRFVTDEGLSVALALYDRTSGAACRPGSTPAGDRCVPDLDVIDQPLQLDATCSRPVVIQYGQARVAQRPDRPGEYLRFETDGGIAREVEVGRLVDGRCQVERIHTGRMTYHVGTPYPPSEWPPLRRTVVGSSEGLTQTSVTLSSGAPLGPTLGLEQGVGLVDGLSVDGSACGPTWVDGVLRCLPGSAQSSDLFADGRCSVSAAWQVPARARGARMLLEDGDARTAWLPTGELRAVTSRAPGPRFMRGPQGCVSWGEGERVVLGERLSAGGLPGLVVQFE
jgi:hypothetical protein